MNDVVLRVEELAVARGGRTLLDGVTLDVRGGELLVLMGENGAGKSTLLAAMAGDVAAARGTVRLHDRPLAAWSALEQARRRAVLPQSGTVDFAFTAFEVALLGRSPHCAGNPGDVDRAIARDALRRTDALHLADRAFPTLSAGERARVLLARAIAQVVAGDPVAAPRVLLLDEPTAALDIAHQHAAFDALRALAADDGVAVAVVVHDPNLALRYADRVALLRGGRLLASGDPDDVLTDALLSACFATPLARLPFPDAAGSFIAARWNSPPRPHSP